MNPTRRAQGVQNSRKKNNMDQKNFTPPLELGAPWEGRGSGTTLPNIHSLAQSMANKYYLIEKNIKNTYNSGMGLQPSPPAL
jgi:hypothetical protein